MSGNDLHRRGLWPFRRHRSAAAPLACPDCQTAMEPKEVLYDPVLGLLMGAHARRHVCPACHASQVFVAGSAKSDGNPVETAPGTTLSVYGMRPWDHRIH
jgi:hypothetical protein